MLYRYTRHDTVFECSLGDSCPICGGDLVSQTNGLFLVCVGRNDGNLKEEERVFNWQHCFAIVEEEDSS
jgi:hypothetical protein